MMRFPKEPFDVRIMYQGKETIKVLFTTFCLQETHCRSILMSHAGFVRTKLHDAMYESLQNNHSGNNNMPCPDNKVTGDTYCYIITLCCFTAHVDDLSSP